MYYRTYETERFIYAYGFYCDSYTNCERKRLNNNTVIQIIESIKDAKKCVKLGLRKSYPCV